MSVRYRKSLGFRKRRSNDIGKAGRLRVFWRAGFRVTAHSSGRVTRTIGLPGTGVSNTSRVGSTNRQRSRMAAAPTPQNYALPKPGFLAGRAEKRYF
jgi:hypothetical protein